jgi:hypothetical protein
MKEQLGKGGPKLFTPWVALQDQELAREDEPPPSQLFFSKASELVRDGAHDPHR